MTLEEALKVSAVEYKLEGNDKFFGKDGTAYLDKIVVVKRGNFYSFLDSRNDKIWAEYNLKFDEIFNEKDMYTRTDWKIDID